MCVILGIKRKKVNIKIGNEMLEQAKRKKFKFLGSIINEDFTYAT